MLNTFILMLALASNPTDAKKHHHKHHRQPKASHVVKQKPRATHHYHARHVLVWKWQSGYYDIYGHWNSGRWILKIK